MHGRVKVRTSEEEKTKKERERQEKLKLYKNAMQKILYKRKIGEMDDKQLQLTEKILTSNPDIYTLWNIRREIIIHLCKIPEQNQEQLTKKYDSELSLTEYCLKVNPKSYCAWHQRKWVLITRSDPDWKKELALCDQYLKLDERNFHTWDYRRFVVSQSQLSLQQEFDYTTEKLHDNFSNYSAWHYRSKMLLQLHPDIEGGRPIKDSHHKHELKLVQSAAFTDPDDTSAWFYQRWLLGAVKTTIQPVVCTVNPDKITIAWNKCVPQDYISSTTKILFDSKVINGKWFSCTGCKYDDLWIFNHDQNVTDDLDVKVQFLVDNAETVTVTCIKYDSCTYVGKNCISFQNIYSNDVYEELMEQLDSCRQLLELEPDNKWTLLTLTFFLYYIDAKKYEDEILSNMDKLIENDSMRSGYYYDLISKWSIEQQLTLEYSKKALDLKMQSRKKITILPHLQYYSYCKIVDLSNQSLTSQVLPSLIKLQHCKELNLSQNKITTVKHLPIGQLNKVYLSGNLELNIGDIQILKSKNKTVEIIL